MVTEPPLIRTFSFHYRERYGHPVGKIPIDTGITCPNRVNGGCIFCSPASFSPGYLNKKDTIADQIARGKKSILKGRFLKYFAYFQQETSTAMDTDKLSNLCDDLLVDKDCIGLIISTRPDCVEDEFLHKLAKLQRKTGKECLFELGVQSAHGKSLKLLNRNHSFADFSDAARRIRRGGNFSLGAHLIFGIPGETEEMMLDTVNRVCSLGVDSLKLHHLQVTRGTQLHEMYKNDKIKLFTMDEYLQFLLKIIPVIPANVTIHRFWATSHPELLIAPKWNILPAKLSAMLQKEMGQRRIFQGAGQNR